MYVYICVCVCVCVRVCVYIYIYIYIYICIYIYIYIFIYIYLHTYTYIHIHIYIDLWFVLLILGRARYWHKLSRRDRSRVAEGRNDFFTCRAFAAAARLLGLLEQPAQVYYIYIYIYIYIYVYIYIYTSISFHLYACPRAESSSYICRETTSLFAVICRCCTCVKATGHNQHRHAIYILCIYNQLSIYVHT